MNHLVGNCNETRAEAAAAMSDWLAGDTIGVVKTENILILGDLNSYDHEAPIKTFEAAGFQDLSKEFQGERAYSYVFDGQLGYLDYALANDALASKVVGTDEWHINSDELPLIDYTLKFKKEAEQQLYAPDAYRSSDHDPVIVGIELGRVEITDVRTDGKKSSYVEVTNTSMYPMDLSGWTLHDTMGTTGMYTFPAGIMLAPGESLRVPGHELGFVLDGNDSVILSDADASELDQEAWSGKKDNNKGKGGKGKGPKN